MVVIIIKMASKNNYNLFDELYVKKIDPKILERGNWLSKSPFFTNIDNAKFFLSKYLPKYLGGCKYNIKISFKESLNKIEIFFDYDIRVARSLKIKKILEKSAK
jgi:hypothetical protein